ncbi:MAG: ATP-binding protein [Gemmatimonadaceae bacterium]|nr:ATP-binding protein [Gemmatimonadaceae bacterium]
MAASRVAFDLRIPSDVDYIEGVVELASQRCRELKFPPSKCSLNVPVALSEALSNAILRGNVGAGGKQVRVRAIIDDHSLVFEVVDEGPGFDLDASTKDCTTDENITREEGRGLFLMRKLMDRVESFQQEGNVVRLTLRRA